MQRPQISAYKDLNRYVGDMIAYRKATEPKYSVLRASRLLRRTSPTLVSLIVKGKRRITLDRVEELSLLLGLSAKERQFFHDALARREKRMPSTPEPKSERIVGKRKQTTSHILKDWINIYVKDAFQLRGPQQDPAAVYATLAGIASQRRVDRAIKFLIREGHLRRTLDGRIVQDVPLDVIDHQIPDGKVRAFHKASLKIAANAIGEYPPRERYANALLVPLDRESHAQLLDLIREFGEKLQAFSERLATGERLYQLLINLSPTGGPVV